MTTTVLATSQLQTVGEWAKIFPRQVTENYTSSVTFMKQLTVVAISTITYLKSLFPEDSYIMETFGGMKLRILKKKCHDKLAQFVSTALMQAFEAFDKKYLHQLALCFYEDECKADNLVECHLFEYTYHESGVTMSVRSKSRDKSEQTLKCTFEDVKDRTVHMIKSCMVIMNSCQGLMPSCSDISLRLYYNEEAPEDYQAPGFFPGDENSDHLPAILPDAICLGSVETPYHWMSARTYIRDNFTSSRDAIASQNPPVMTPNETPECSVFPEMYVVMFVTIRQCTGSSRRFGFERNELRIRCPCNKYYAEDSEEPEDLITCTFCMRQQHATCYGVLKERIGSLEGHCCTECYDSDPYRVPTDPQLASLTHKQRESLCIFRRALRWCWLEGEMSLALLQAKGFPAHGAMKLLRLLRKHQVLLLDDDDSPEAEKVNRKQLKAMMEKYFNSTKEQNMVDRLVAETFSSQESRPDPIGDVLGPMEKINLQNDATIGRIVKPVENEPAVEDETLKQYRAAVFSNNREEEEMSFPADLNKKTKGKRKLEEQKSKLKTGVRRIKRARK